MSVPHGFKFPDRHSPRYSVELRRRVLAAQASGRDKKMVAFELGAAQSTVYKILRASGYRAMDVTDAERAGIIERRAAAQRKACA